MREPEDDDAEHDAAMPRLADDAEQVHRNACTIEVPMKATAHH